MAIDLLKSLIEETNFGVKSFDWILFEKIYWIYFKNKFCIYYEQNNIIYKKKNVFGPCASSVFGLGVYKGETLDTLFTDGLPHLIECLF